ncbi:hypothetical protein KP005_18325 [Geomonas nitrogeniifigens]|uniref:DNA-binding protein n=1 Tax=Geomonas diazotrophica TaxID=2843197 RepID=A0ABX8JJD2_9BACT|nr:hypothetical protein [Geomonas nitrogeniifigens]QWV97276.1 hypothetical protein KP005_18325 [Geomonas nitrogeniifigens]
MPDMNQTACEIRLVEYMNGPDGWGNMQGRAVGARVQAFVQKQGCDIFKISFAGVNRTDASFSRESVVEIACRYRGKKGFAIHDLFDADLIENLESAALRKDQPLFIWDADSWQIAGPKPSRGSEDVLVYALSTPGVTASGVSVALNLKLTNASTKLKQLWEGGYILRKEEVAPSGGIEFIYYRIK